MDWSLYDIGLRHERVKSESITITAKLIVVVKASRLKYEQAKIEKAEKKLKDSKNEQLEIITKKINELKTKVDSLKKSK